MTAQFDHTHDLDLEVSMPKFEMFLFIIGVNKGDNLTPLLECTNLLISRILSSETPVRLAQLYISTHPSWHSLHGSLDVKDANK